MCTESILGLCAAATKQHYSRLSRSSLLVVLKSAMSHVVIGEDQLVKDVGKHLEKVKLTSRSDSGITLVVPDHEQAHHEGDTATRVGRN